MTSVEAMIRALNLFKFIYPTKHVTSINQIDCYKRDNIYIWFLYKIKTHDENTKYIEVFKRNDFIRTRIVEDYKEV